MVLSDSRVARVIATSTAFTHCESAPPPPPCFFSSFFQLSSTFFVAIFLVFIFFWSFLKAPERLRPGQVITGLLFLRFLYNDDWWRSSCPVRVLLCSACQVRFSKAIIITMSINTTRQVWCSSFFFIHCFLAFVYRVSPLCPASLTEALISSSVAPAVVLTLTPSSPSSDVDLFITLHRGPPSFVDYDLASVTPVSLRCFRSPFFHTLSPLVCFQSLRGLGCRSHHATASTRNGNTDLFFVVRCRIRCDPLLCCRFVFTSPLPPPPLSLSLPPPRPSFAHVDRWCRFHRCCAVVPIPRCRSILWRYSGLVHSHITRSN